MACQSCRRNLLQLSRQAAHSGLEVQQPGAAAQLTLATITTRTSFRPRQQQQQRRGLRSTPVLHEQEQQTEAQKIAAFQRSLQQPQKQSWVRKLLQRSAQPYQVLGATESIYKTCAKMADYTISETDKRNGTVKKTAEGEEIGTSAGGSWHRELNLPPTFSTWSQVTMLHLYLVVARIRDLDAEASRSWQKQLLDHFFFDAEERMDVTHGISSRALRHGYLKDLFVQWRGIIAAYDEGLARGDAVLAAAVWRNVYKGSAAAAADPRRLAAVVAWMRGRLRALDDLPDEALFGAAEVLDSPVARELSLVDRPSRELEGALDSGDAIPAERDGGSRAAAA